MRIIHVTKKSCRKKFVTASAETPLTTTSAENKKNTKIICSRENKMILLRFFFETKKLCETIRS